MELVDVDPSQSLTTAAGSCLPIAAEWPPAEEWPACDAPPREWAAFYRDRLGLVVLPSPSPFDTTSHAMSLYREAVADWADEHGDEPVPEETWDDAREIAARYRKGALAYIKRDKYQRAEDVTDADLDLWFVSEPRSRGARAHAHERGIVVLPGRSSRGFPLVLVDTDPRHGGDLTGPWANMLGPRASTPGLAYGDPESERRQGVHCLALATGKERSSQNHLAPGVDVVAGGGTPIPLPAGNATQHRRWLSLDPPRPAPAALCEVPRKRPPPRPGEQAEHADGRPRRVREREPGDDDDDLGGAGDHGPGAAAYAVANQAGVGERNRGASLIVGMLARPRACPPDFVRACLELLAEEFEGRDRGGTDELRREAEEWRRLLTRGPRDADFAADLVACWIRCRDVNPRRWRDSKSRQVARSIWKSCDRREGGEAGAEDFGVGGPLGHRPSGWPSPWRVASAAEAVEAVALAQPTAHDHATPEGPLAPTAGATSSPTPPVTPAQPAVDVLNPPPPTAAQRAEEAKKWRGGIDPHSYVRTLAEYYPPDRLERDMARRPVRVDDVMPLMDFATGRYLRPEERPGYGWGSPLDLALGGLSPGDVRFIGAAGAGAGKTWFECFLANGLALATACRILGYKGFEDRPIVLPIWVTEMPKRGEILWRLAGQFHGFDLAAITWGEDAARAPGVVAHARDLGGGWTPEHVVTRARAHVAQHISRPTSREDSPVGLAYHRLLKMIEISRLPTARARSGALAVDHQTGAVLVDHIADAVAMYRSDLADELAVPESDVLPLIMVDPGQRFAGTGREQRAMIDAFFGAVVSVLAGELECAVLGTLDTTKDAARNVDVDAFLGGDASALAAQMAAGSQAIMHNADVIGLCAERPAPDQAASSAAVGPPVTTMWARLLKGRTGIPAECYPFEWEKSRGRFRARPAEGLRPDPRREDGDRVIGGGRRDDAGGRRPPPVGGPPIGHHPVRQHHPTPHERRLVRAGEADD